MIGLKTDGPTGVTKETVTLAHFLDVADSIVLNLDAIKKLDAQVRFTRWLSFGSLGIGQGPLAHISVALQTRCSLLPDSWQLLTHTALFMHTRMLHAYAQGARRAS
jgi:hypothetical protein